MNRIESTYDASQHTPGCIYGAILVGGALALGTLVFTLKASLKQRVLWDWTAFTYLTIANAIAFFSIWLLFRWDLRSQSRCQIFVDLDEKTIEFRYLDWRRDDQRIPKCRDRETISFDQIRDCREMARYYEMRTDIGKVLIPNEMTNLHRILRTIETTLDKSREAD